MVITVVRHRTIGDKAVMWIQALNGGVTNLIHVYRVDGHEDRTSLENGVNYGSDPDIAEDGFNATCLRVELEEEEAEWEERTEAANR
ncbi:hypothetical protein JCM19235_1291 [Vibrio maritimus]|uniref:Uncharacterized protein n=1 Tax=Vibrio maritimus TaxID=990268 RepID=A0A090S5N0_9VIBR|nr:hypothetical protein JCM19235_1291 [Vibrio maritimus]